MARIINDDVKVLGTLSAEMLDGAFSEKSFKSVKDKLSMLETQTTECEMRFAQAEARYVALADKYNAAIEVINNLSERLAALESNYDPTVIK